MYPCEKCLENIWWYEYIDGWVIATCKNCGNEVEFETKNSDKPRIKAVGDLCRNCGTPVILKKFKFNYKKLKKRYYYTACYFCPRCKTDYFSDEFKVINKLSPEKYLTIFK
jgi:hypothetical protein